MKWLEKLKKGNSSISYFLRFCIVGGISTFTLYAVYYLLVLGQVNPSISYSIGYVIAFITNYLLTTKFTFQVKTNKKNGIGFIITNIINYFLSIVLLNIFIWIGIDKTLALLPALVISVPINYIMVKFVMKRV